VKIGGTIICVVGAFTMSLMQGTNSIPGMDSFPLLGGSKSEDIIDKGRIIGCLYLMAAVLVLSSNVVLQVIINS